MTDQPETEAGAAAALANMADFVEHGKATLDAEQVSNLKAMLSLDIGLLREACATERQRVEALEKALREEHAIVRSIGGVDAGPHAGCAIELLLASPPEPHPTPLDVERLRETLALHYVTAIDCDHDAGTDTIRCNCSVWTGTPQPSVGAAVREWVDHTLAALTATGQETDR